MLRGFALLSFLSACLVTSGKASLCTRQSLLSVLNCSQESQQRCQRSFLNAMALPDAERHEFWHIDHMCAYRPDVQITKQAVQGRQRTFSFGLCTASAAGAALGSTFAALACFGCTATGTTSSSSRSSSNSTCRPASETRCGCSAGAGAAAAAAAAAAALAAGRAADACWACTPKTVHQQVHTVCRGFA